MFSESKLLALIISKSHFLSANRVRACTGYSFFYGISADELQEYCDAMGYEFLENGTLF